MMALALATRHHFEQQAATDCGDPATLLRAEALADHAEALADAGALRRGIRLTVLCTALLAGAVAVTWYAPPQDPPALLARQGSTWCGAVESTSHGTVVRSVNGESTPVDLAAADLVRPVTSCPASG